MQTYQGYTEFIFSKVNLNRVSNFEFSEIEKYEDMEFFCAMNEFVEVDGIIYQYKGSKSKYASTQMNSRILVKHGRHIHKTILIK